MVSFLSVMTFPQSHRPQQGHEFYLGTTSKVVEHESPPKRCHPHIGFLKQHEDRNWPKLPTLLHKMCV